MAGRIHLSRPHITDLEERLVMEALRSGWVAPLGPMVDRFEAAVAERTGVEHALALSSGTAALHLALLEVGAGPGTVVVVPSMTFAASANAVTYTGAEPVLVDSGEDANVDPGLLLEAVRTLRAEGATVAAVMTVDLMGRCCDYDALLDGLAELDVPVIEDAAEALGASTSGRPAGSFGVAAALSFNGNKILTTSGGGMLLTDDEKLVSHARHLSTQAREPVPWYEHAEVGYNYRLSNVLAAIGVAQLERLPEMIERRRAIRDRYAAALADVDGVELLGRNGGRSDTEDNCWLTALLLDPSLVDADPGSVIEVLGADDIEARHLWKPMHLQPVFAGARAFVTGTSERLFRTGVTLPSGSELSDDDVDRVIASLRGALGVG